MELMTAREGADRLKVHVRTLERWAREGRIEAFKIVGSSRLRFTRDAVEGALQRVTARSPAEGKV